MTETKRKIRRVISNERLPTSIPAASMLSLGLLLDRLHAPIWIWWFFGIFCVAIVLVVFSRVRDEVQVEVDV
jgi:hypothetical protein